MTIQRNNILYNSSSVFLSNLKYALKLRSSNMPNNNNSVSEIRNITLIINFNTYD